MDFSGLWIDGDGFREPSPATWRRSPQSVFPPLRDMTHHALLKLQIQLALMRPDGRVESTLSGSWIRGF